MKIVSSIFMYVPPAAFDDWCALDGDVLDNTEQLQQSEAELQRQIAEVRSSESAFDMSDCECVVQFNKHHYLSWWEYVPESETDRVYLASNSFLAMYVRLFCMLVRFIHHHSAIPSRKC